MSPACYRIVVEGELGPRYASAFAGMTLHAQEGETELVGTVIDPSHLHAVLERIAGLGLTLHSLTAIEPETLELDASPHPQTAGTENTDPGTDSKGP